MKNKSYLYHIRKKSVGCGRMTTIEHWKIIIKQANKAFARQQLQQANALYQQAVILLLYGWDTAAEYADNTLDDNDTAQHDDQLTLFVICLSISVQNLTESYARQRRWRRCIGTLNRMLQHLQQLQHQLPAHHPASIAVLREGCNVRRELCRFSKLRQQEYDQKAGKVASFSLPAVSMSIH